MDPLKPTDVVISAPYIYIHIYIYIDSYSLTGLYHTICNKTRFFGGDYDGHLDETCC